MKEEFTRSEIIFVLVKTAIATTFSILTIKWMVDLLDPTREQKKKAKTLAQNIMRKLKLSPDMNLNEYELTIASNLVDPHQLPTSWNDIAGLDGILQELKDTVILPVQKSHLFGNSQLLQPPKGVLLHGPPGCGKTMVAKATAKQAGMNFINLDASSLVDKWYGESQKLVAAVFTLAVKIQPCIIFIDEIDSLLRVRDSHDHEATAMMKAMFMSLWDGLTTTPQCQVIIMGATNRPQDVDRAILRRMPSTFLIGLPEQEQRRQILRVILIDERLGADVDLIRLSKLTEGFSGSDLRELCRNAAILTVKDINYNEESVIPEIAMAHLLAAYQKMRESKLHCGTLPLKPLSLD